MPQNKLFELKDIKPQLGEYEVAAIEGSIACARLTGNLIKHEHGDLNIIIFPSGNMMRS